MTMLSDVVTPLPEIPDPGIAADLNRKATTTTALR